ncbi:MAG: glucose-1-phosphate thymidylyltransferase [Planctomycetota bacterium]
MKLAPEDFFDLSHFWHRDLFRDCAFVWDALPKIAAHIRSRLRPGIHGRVETGAHIIGDVSIAPGTIVEAGAFIRGPAIIGRDCHIRANAYLRGDVLVGDGCVVGNATELKNSVLLDGAAAPHYNYCGDSILGGKANLGAGTKLSNFKISAEKSIHLVVDGTPVDTGLSKFGAILGDNAQTGCNSVLNPGTVIGRNSLVYACAAVRGYVPPDTIVKLRQELELTPIR